MSKNNFQERLRKMEDTKQRFSIRKFSIGAASVLIGLTIFGMGNETVHAAEQPAQNQNGGVQTSAVNKEESDASKAKQEAETSVNVNSEVTENMQEVSVDQKANTAQLEKKAPASAVKEEKTVADPTPAKERNATSKQDSASAQTSQPAVDSVKQNAKKTQQVGNDKAALATTITLNEPKSSVVELTKSKATVQDENSTTVVTSAKGLIDAIQKGTANTINIGANIDLGTISSYSSYTNTNISNKRNIIIQSVAGKHCTVDFNGYGFNMYSSDYGVTFKNLDLYGRSYYGIVRSAGSYTFDNVNYTGSELIYTDPGYNTTVNFDGNVTAHSVGSYTTPLNSRSSQKSQGGDTQQVIQFAGGTKNTITINFNSGSNVTLTTTNSNVVEVDKGTTTINVKNGAQVSLNPHTQIFTEQHRMRMDGIARGIASDGNTTLNIDQGGNLDINLTKNTKDWYLSGALYLNSGATINVNGNLNINSNGKPYYRSQGWDDPVYINGKATINVKGGSFKVNATNIGDYEGSIVTSNGNTTIAINHHGTFDVTGDGAKATGVSLGNGSTFTSTQPELFNISMPDGATAIAIKNGKVQFNGVKTSADSQPIGEIDITYKDGIPKVTKVTSYDEATTTATRTAVRTAVNKAKNKINLVAAGKEVDLKDIMFTKDADGNYIMSGIANTADNNGAYVYISVNGTVHQVAPTDSQTLYTVGPTGGPTSSQVPYTAETGADGEFSVNLGKLKDTDQVSLYAAKDFVTSDKDTKTVSEWMTSFYRDQLQKLVDEAPTVEGGSNYINATDSLKTAYANAISDGSAFLQNPSATSEQLEAAATAITTAKTALNGDLNKVKQDLEAAVKDAPNVRNTPAYYNAASAKQQAYNTAISDGSEALKAQNPTVESLTDALNKINEAKSALDGQPTDKQALQAAVNKSKDVKDSNNYANADQNAKTAYDNAVTAAQGVLDNSNATQAQVTQALQDLNTANGKLNGDAKTEEVKQALEAAVKDAPNVRNTPAYYNAASAKQQAYNTAISDGSEALKAQNPTVESLTDALNKINEAKSALDGQPTDKQALQAAVNKSKDVKDSNNYANADQNAKTAYDNAVTAAQGVLDNSNATQAQVTQALQDLNTANGKLNGDAKTEEVKQALEAAVKDAPNVRNTPAYYNAASAKQQAYNTAISDGSEALKAQNPTVESLTDALNKINEAKSALDGQPTDKQALQAAVNKSKDVKDSNNYANADQNAKTAYDNAVTAAQGVLDNSNATQAQVTQALQDLNTANGKLNGDAKTEEVKQALEAAVKDAPNVRNTPAYYNAASAKQQAYNTAISDGSEALKAQNPTVESLTDALNKINDAKAALDGQPTNKQALQAAVNNSKDVKDSNNYANADQNAKTAYDNAVTAAQGVLGNSNATQAQVTQALQDLNTANDNLNGDAKTEAANRQALEDAVKEAPTVEKTDSKYYNGTEKAQDDYKNAVSEGQKVLDNANATADQIKTALDNINAAKGALDGDPTNKTILQNSVDNAVDLDKSNADAQAKKDYTDALNKAKQVLAYPNATQQAVNEANAALTNAKTALDNSSALQNAKDALQRAVDAKSTTEKTPAYYNAASAKQQAYNTAISAGSDALKAQNPTVESLTTALNKINEAKSALDGKATDTSKLKAAVDNANTVKASNDYKDASADDQKQYDDAVKAGQQLLDPTTAPSPLTQADVDRAAKAITDAQSALTTSATTNVKDAKGKATADLTNAVDASKKAIDQDTNLTEDERNAAKAQVDSDASAAKEAINKATTNDAVTSAATAGKVTIDKTVANAAIDNAAAGKNKAIDGSSLTDEEKNGIKDQVAQAVKTAKDIISAADTEQAVTTAQKNGVAAIDGIKVPTESATKTAADKAIDEALANKQAEINKSTTLTDEEKANLNQQAQNAANTAKQNIANAKTDSAVATAQENGVAAIDGIKVPTESATKTAADKAIDEALANKQAEINKSTTLTDEEKANLNQQAQNAANTAKQNIANAKTDSAVATAQDNGVAAIDGIKVSANSTAKDQAKSNITDAADKAKQTIDQDNNLTNDQKQAAKAQVDADAKTAQEAINKATTNDDVTSATNTGKLAIDKAVANAAIDNAVAGKKAEISNAKDLSSDDVKALNNEVDQAANDAKNAISSATTEKAVKTAQTDGVDKINAIDVATTAAKDKAKSDIDQTANDAKKAIDDNKDLTDDQKTAAKDQIDQDATKAKDNINNAKTDKDVEDANNAGQLAIAKDGAKAAIQGALNKKLNEIDSASALTSDEKAKLTNDANTAATNANKAIDAATTPIEVTSAQTAGIQDIENVKVPAESTTKDQAKSNITDAADKAKQTIDQDNNLTNDQKQAAKDQVDTDAKNAQDAIDNAKTDADVNNAADNGKIAIDKTVADAAIDNAVAGKIKDVKAPLTTDEQKTLTDLIKETGENAKQNIANATTPAEVTIAQDAGVNAIDQINVPTTSPVKDAADKAIDEALKNKTAAINKADNITDQEKHSLIDKVNKAADDATSAIKNATTDNAVKDAETKGLNEINGVTIPTLAEKQQAANVAIDQAAKAKKAEIAKALQAGNIDQAKADSLNTEVDNDVTNAMKAIANATTNAAVVVAQNDGIHKIKAIKVPSSTYNPDITNNTSTGSGDTDSTSTKPAEEATLKLILTHNAYIYNKDYQITYKDNKRVVLKKGTQIIALDNGKKYLIKGKEFYRIGDNQYVKVSNTISYYYLVHNSFLYNKHGKTIKRNGKRILVRKGVRLEANKVKVVKINGKKFYKVGKSTYIKFRNVKLIISPNN